MTTVAWLFFFFVAGQSLNASWIHPMILNILVKKPVHGGWRTAYFILKLKTVWIVFRKKNLLYDTILIYMEIAVANFSGTMHDCPNTFPSSIMVYLSGAQYTVEPISIYQGNLYCHNISIHERC